MAVRRESVRIDVDSNLAAVAARDAAAVKLLANTVDSLSDSAVQSDRQTQKVAQSVSKSGVAATQAAPKVSSLAAAQNALAKAEAGAADAAGKVRVAEMRLAEVRDSGKAKASQVAAAEESLARSRRSLEGATVNVTKATTALVAANENVDASTRRADTSINQLTGRLRLLGDVAAILGPALIPIGALAVPAVAGLANQLGFAAAAGGTAILAFQGVGDAVTAMNEYAFAPTEANAAKVEESLAKLSPAAQEFATRIGEMRSQFVATRDAAAEGLFPGLTDSLDDLDGLLGRVQPVLREIGSATGDMIGDGLASLNSDRWQPFFDFLQAEARPTLIELGQTVGDFGHGLSELWMAFQPLNRDFGSWLSGVADGFDGWASGLSETEGFQDFIDYIRDSGPQVAETMGALGRALVSITTAAAPLGGPALAGIEAFANAISAVADSDIGTPIFTAIAAMALFNRAMALGRSSLNAFGQTRTNFASLSGGLDGLSSSAERSRAGLTGLARTAGGVAAVAGAVTLLGNALADATGAKVDSSNLARDVEALANGADPKLLEQVGNSLQYMSGFQNKAAEPIREVFTAFGLFGGTPMDNAKNNLKEVDQTLAGLVESGNPERAEKAFQRVMEAMTGAPEGTSFADSVRNKALESFTGYATALENAEAANEGYAGSTDEAAASAASAAASVNELAQAMRTQASEALSAFDAQTAWGQAVADAREQANSGAKGIDEMTEAGRGNREALSNLASTWNSQSRAVKNNVGEYKQARRTFMDFADSMGLGEGQARRLANQLLEMPRSMVVDFKFRGFKKGLDDSILLGGQLGNLHNTVAAPVIMVNGRPANAVIGTVRGNLAFLDKFRASPSVTVNAAQAGAALGGIIGQLGRVDGWHATSSQTHTITTIQKTIRMGVNLGGAIGAPRAGGGLIQGPGTETSDSILTPTSRNEFVQRAAAVRYYGEQFMNDINNMRIPRQQMERQGVQAAMRSSSGRQNVNVNVSSRGYLDLSDGRRITLDTIDERIDQRIDDVLFNRDEFDRSESARVSG